MRKTFFIVLLFFVFQVNATECQRIISQSPYITMTLQWLGLQECIVGVSRYDRLELPHTGGIFTPDKEAIANLIPDIVFTSDRTKPEVLNDITPEDARSYILHGFHNMAQIEENLRVIGNATNIKNIETIIEKFRSNWQSFAKKLDGNGKKVLLISSCSGNPYSFGKRTWMHDLFTQAGFQVVETHDRIRHIKKGHEVEEITSLLDKYSPDLLFIFERTLHPQCQVMTPKVPVKIVTTDGELFLHPAPILLKGLDALYARRSAWAK